MENSGLPTAIRKGGGRSWAGHLALCLQSQARIAHEGWLGAQNSSFPLNRHRRSVEILETSDLLQNISRVVREGQREGPRLLQVL